MTEQKIIYDGICEESKAGPCGVVIFGASGDLTRRKLLPAFFRLYKNNSLPENFFIIGFARSKINDKKFREIVKEAINGYIKKDKSKVEDFISKCFYCSGQYDDLNSYKTLKTKVQQLNKDLKTKDNIVFSLSTPPALYVLITKMLGESRLLVKNKIDEPFNRIIIEKPFGRDYKSAIDMHSQMGQYASDKQIYRIDHYLGKDTVQNIFVFRFANSIFEPVWNRENIDHIQITVAEDIGIGTRAGYFNENGLIRDMLQNHLLQLLCYVAMEPPANMVEDSVRDEKTKVLKSIRPIDLNKIEEAFVLGQYDFGTVNGKEVVSYRSEENVPPNSFVETYFATKLFIDNWRWEGVPFYLRCGKRLKEKQSKISIVFKTAPKSVFSELGISDKLYNVITFNIYPEQGVSLRFQAKLPESKTCLGSLNMNFNYQSEFGEELTADYDSLMLDCMLGNQSLFWREDQVEISWKLLTPVLEKFENSENEIKRELVHQYTSGGWGPKTADDFINKDGKHWIY